MSVCPPFSSRAQHPYSKICLLWGALSPGCINLSRSKTILSVRDDRRFRTISIFPYKTGDFAPSGGGGPYFELIWKKLPINNAGGQVEKAIVSFGLCPLNISLRATEGLWANMWPNWLTTTLKLASSKGRSSTSHEWKSTFKSIIFEFFWRVLSKRA